MYNGKVIIWQFAAAGGLPHFYVQSHAEEICREGGAWDAEDILKNIVTIRPPNASYL
ncbi:MAG: hypothetical protein K2I96_07715 [Lachnospiraceae bacterium]|nr:hypothetical protein [Lachnospiraceae bacterium]